MTGTDPTGRGRPIAIWAAPRSVSTAFEKTFTRLPGVRVVHEPFADCYYFGPSRRSARYGHVPNLLDYDSDKALQSLQPRAGETVVFKDLCFQAASYVSDEFLTSVTNTFIVRHPDLVVESLRKLKPDFTEEELGFAALAGMLDRVEGLGQSPVVVEGEVFRASPEQVLRQYCSTVGLSFHSAMLSWSDGRIRPWAPHEAESQAKWHSTLEASTHIEPPRADRPPVPGDLGEAYREAVDVYDRVVAHMPSPAIGAMAS